MQKGAAACPRSPSSQVYKCPDRAASWHVQVCGIPPCDRARSPGHTGSGWSALQWPPPHSPRSSAVTGSGWLSPSGGSGSRTGPRCSRPRIPVQEREGERRGKGLGSKPGTEYRSGTELRDTWSWCLCLAVGRGDPTPLPSHLGGYKAPGSRWGLWTQRPRFESWLHHLLAK